MRPLRSLRVLFVCFVIVLASSVFAQPRLRAESALIIDAKSGKILGSKDADSIRFPASTTKILSTLIFLENVELDEIIIAPKEIESITGSSLHLKPFEEINAEDLAYAMLLRSANDGCYAAAVHVSGSVEAFSQKMNERAKEIGCTNSNFTNPHGLHAEEHYTTAKDLALIAKEAMKNEIFAKIVAARERTVARSLNDKDVLVQTHNTFLKNNDFATGIKTGWTDPAGRCFVGSAEIGDVSIITVVLKSTNWLRDSERLADWAFDKWHYSELVSRDEIVEQVTVAGADRETVRLAAVDEVTTLVRSDISTPFDVIGQDLKLQLPIAAGSKLGTVTVREHDGTEHTVDVYSADDVFETSSFQFKDLLSPSVLLILLLLIGGSWIVRRRARVKF